MKKRRNFLLVEHDDGTMRALNISHITQVREIKSGTSKILTTEGFAYDIKKNYKEVLNIILGKAKK